MEPHLWSIQESLAALTSKACSAEELTAWTLQRIHKYNPSLHAYISVAGDAIEAARRSDEQRAAGQPLGPLAGIPIAVKDLFDTADLATTYGGRHYDHYRPSETATVVRRLRDAGAIVIGKTNLHEYAFGTTNENPHFGTARNPWNKAKITGGSSGGSSVAIVAGLCTAAIGTDTGGSVRIPAALTGHVGLKPTYGLVSNHGVFPLAPSLDHVGPMTKTVQDAALLLDVMAGFDSRDPNSVRANLNSYALAPVRRNPVFGVPRHFFFERCHPNVLQVVQSAVQLLERQGVVIREVDIPMIDDVPDMQRILITSEARFVHRDLFRDRAELYGPDVRERLQSADGITGSDYVKALSFRTEFHTRLKEVFRTVNLLITPTTPLVATDIGQAKAHVKMQEFNVRAHLTRYTNPWNFSGLPAISIPCGMSSDGLPVGLQIVGPYFAEQTLLGAGQFVEELVSWQPIAADYR